jgi:hypothetical protein
MRRAGASALPGSTFQPRSLGSNGLARDTGGPIRAFICNGATGFGFGEARNAMP